MDYAVEAGTSDPYASIDIAIERIERQIKKHKEIVKHRLHRHDRVPQEELFADWPGSSLEAG